MKVKAMNQLVIFIDVTCSRLTDPDYPSENSQQQRYTKNKHSYVSLAAILLEGNVDFKLVCFNLPGPVPKHPLAFLLYKKCQ